MHKLLFKGVLITGLFLIADFGLTSCASSAHCPAVAGTGNSASRKMGGAKKKYCAGVKGTGNFKPRVKRKKEDGLTSKKMERAMAKSERKKAGPLQQKTLSVDQ
ncbi:MAG: hypothetical protein AAGN35_27185 [Bacteroidota bacterium]